LIVEGVKIARNLVWYIAKRGKKAIVVKRVGRIEIKEKGGNAVRTPVGCCILVIVKVSCCCWVEIKTWHRPWVSGQQASH
jgi:hypothetical protein